MKIIRIPNSTDTYQPEHTTAECRNAFNTASHLRGRPRGEAFNRHLAAHGYTVIQTDPSTLAETERFECAVIDDWARCELAGIIGQFDKEHFVAWTSGDFYAGRAIRPLSPKFRTKPKYRLC
jgi:hypothetical protein